MGLAIGTEHIAVLGLVLLVFLLWFLPVISEEESHLRTILPKFREYESRVPRFLPALKPRYRSSTRFDPGLYLKNREYMAALACGAFVLVLWVKLRLL